MSKRDDPHHAMIGGALVARGARLCFTSQIPGEFRNASMLTQSTRLAQSTRLTRSTRPGDQNGFGLSTAEKDRIARVIERDFEFPPDSRDVQDGWRRLLLMHEIKGVQVHDARLAASMCVHGIAQLLTSNGPTRASAAGWGARPTKANGMGASGRPS